jgi:hypothetical protein
VNWTLTKCDAIYVAKCALGRGVFADRDFQEGEFLFRFTGPVISLVQAINKGDAEGNALQIGPTTYIDLETPGVFANHSCEPNAGVRDLVSGYALRPISRGEEILYDYSTTMSEQRWSMRCRCGVPSCRGMIGDFHDLPSELQRRYLSMGIVQPFIVAELRSLHARLRKRLRSSLSSVVRAKKDCRLGTSELARYTPC